MYIRSKVLVLIILSLIDKKTYMSSLEFMSSENVSLKGVIASLAVFIVKSKAPAIIVVSWSDNSPPFPA